MGFDACITNYIRIGISNCIYDQYWLWIICEIMIYINDVMQDKIDSAFDDCIWNNIHAQIEYEKQNGLFDGIY